MIKLVSASLVSGKVLRLAFSDGSTGECDLTEILARDTSLTRPLAQSEYFARFFLELGALCWPNGLELSARSLHERLKRSGALHQPATA